MLRNQGKILENLENLSKIPENPGKTAAQPCLTSNINAQRLQKNTWRPLFWRSHQIKIFMVFVGENFQVEVAQKLFRQVCKYSGKIIHTHKNLPAPTPMMQCTYRL